MVIFWGSRHHWDRFDKEYRSAESENMLEREILDTLTFSLRVWGSRMETQCKHQQLSM